MAKVELRHAEKWETALQDAGMSSPQFQPARRTKILAWLARRFGPEWILPSMQNMEKDGAQGYVGQVGGKAMAAEEQSHSLLLSTITRSMRGARKCIMVHART